MCFFYSVLHPASHTFGIRVRFIGAITTKTRVNYEAIKQIYVNAYVTDTGIPQLTSTAEIIVDVVNINDNDPVFALAEYRFAIAENAAKATVIGTVDAKDSDDGEFLFCFLSLIFFISDFIQGNFWRCLAIFSGSLQ